MYNNVIRNIELPVTQFLSGTSGGMCTIFMQRKKQYKNVLFFLFFFSLFLFIIHLFIQHGRIRLHYYRSQLFDRYWVNFFKQSMFKFLTRSLTLLPSIVVPLLMLLLSKMLRPSMLLISMMISLPVQPKISRKLLVLIVSPRVSMLVPMKMLMPLLTKLLLHMVVLMFSLPMPVLPVLILMLHRPRKLSLK